MYYDIIAQDIAVIIDFKKKCSFFLYDLPAKSNVWQNCLSNKKCLLSITLKAYITANIVHRLDTCMLCTHTNICHRICNYWWEFVKTNFILIESNFKSSIDTWGLPKNPSNHHQWIWSSLPSWSEWLHWRWN